MIVPTKGVLPSDALLSVGADIINVLEEPLTISELWLEIGKRRSDEMKSTIGFDWFVLALDLAWALGAVKSGPDGILTRSGT